jgi:hypothetical protein
MYSPGQLGESPCSFDISSPDEKDSQEETEDLFNFDYVGKKKTFLDRETLQAMFLKNLKESWRYID